jgi:hypothetical protein
MSEHPKDRPAEPADPLQMMASGVEGDPGVMFDCVVEEYSRLGYDAVGILGLFENPEFLATHGLRGLFGPEATRKRVSDVLSRCGILRVTATVAPPDFSCDSGSCHA